jgi:Tfp pilus assembly protein PilF
MKRPQLILKRALDRMLNSADEAWARHDFEQSLELLERASRLHPSNLNILLKLGQRYGLRYQPAQSERCFEQAIRVAPNKAEMLALAGRFCAELRYQQIAERFFQQALGQKEVTAGIIARLAELYERMGRAEAATAMVERALLMDNDCPLACLIQAKLHRQAGKSVDAEQVLRPILTTGDREMRVRGWYEMGVLYDRQDRFDEAMAAFLEAKALLHQDAPPLLAQFQSVIQHLQDVQKNVSAEMLARWSDTGREQLQPAHRLAFLGGHPRSGTTLLEQVLDSHPDIVSAEETTIFHNEAYAPVWLAMPQGVSRLAGLDSAPVQILRFARERYFNSMSLALGQPPGQRLLIDKNPSLQPWIITFIRVFPEARLIVALRDPRDVVLSCFMLAHWPLGSGNVNFLELETTVNFYALTMGMWQTLKPLVKNPWLEVRYEDMVDNLETAARKTMEFLDVPWEARVLNFHEHARNKSVHSPSYADVTQPVYKRSVCRWRNYQKYLEPHLARLEPFVKGFGYE